ncbi:IS66 family insertion sequence element accessory protein TnpB [Engelhardtia mirabilis]|uniref:IS66 Orf2 like protein n=1 Tax=Engelhardtia mirabilis TaxID=2528011 RepID=A0A518BS96_9BACT|nr:IS66 Orf2 like protein [Planctomycetes bacterium Pla133]QDV04167.1 IS66 Orf2 like protein [Planctomycetes bacterium Pla86]
MLTLGAGRRVFLVAGSTDMRKSFDGLSGVVRSALQGDPKSGDLFVFCNRLRNRLKVLYVDESGVWVCAKRLERGTFKWPSPTSGERRVEMRSEELALLLGGLDAKELKARAWKRDTRTVTSANFAIRP